MLDFVQSPERIKYPLIKNKETGEFERATWDEALDLVASKFMEIRKQYGSDSLAGFACSRSPNEDIYMVQKMVRCCSAPTIQTTVHVYVILHLYQVLR